MHISKKIKLTDTYRIFVNRVLFRGNGARCFLSRGNGSGQSQNAGKIAEAFVGVV